MELEPSRSRVSRRRPASPRPPGLEPLLIIGHTTSDSALVWVGGTHRDEKVRLELCEGDTPCEASPPVELKLREEKGFTEVHPFRKLTAQTTYHVHAHFHPRPRPWNFLRHNRGVTKRRGRFQTFPDEGSRQPFRFLFGSCNLSVVNLTHFGGLAAGMIGTIAARSSLNRDRATFPGRWLRRLVRWVLGKLSPFMFMVLYWLTGFEQPKPLLNSPFHELLSGSEDGNDAREGDAVLSSSGVPEERAVSPSDRGGGPVDRAAFMLHAGDQIYFDVPFPRRKPTAEEYRKAYRQAWSEDEHMRKLLSRCPHYMILDDHEIVDGFARDFIPAWAAHKPDATGKRSPVETLLRLLGKQPERDRTPQDYLVPARKVYLEYVHSRHPELPREHLEDESEDPEADASEPLYYEFAHGTTRFFVLDTRTERWVSRGEMIGEQQMGALEEFLRKGPEAMAQPPIRFIVTSVPFIAHLREEDSSPDKWTSDLFRRQRDRIIEMLVEATTNGEVGPVVFLTGDMHCSYHARMRIGPPGRRLTIHEFASGPINQLDFPHRYDFYPHYRGATMQKKLPFTTSLRRIHQAAGNVVEMTVLPEQEEIRWKVLHTRSKLTHKGDDGGSSPARAQPEDEPGDRAETFPPPMQGSVRLRTTAKGGERRERV